MAETLTVTVDDGGTYTVNVPPGDVALFTDANLTTPGTFPAAIAADTTWYAAAPSGGHPQRRHITVYISAADGTQVVTPPLTQLPATISASEGTVSYSAPSQSGGSSAVAWTAVKTADYAASSGDAVPADASGGDFNVTLPVPAANARVTVKNVGATGTVTVLPHGSETIDGGSSNVISTQWASRDYQSDGNGWLVV